MKSSCHRAAAAAAGSLCNRFGRPCVAPTRPPPEGVLGLNASASVEVAKDVLVVTFSTTREGSEANAVQAQLKQALDAALDEAKKVGATGTARRADRQLLALSALCELHQRGARDDRRLAGQRRADRRGARHGGHRPAHGPHHDDDDRAASATGFRARRARRSRPTSSARRSRRFAPRRRATRSSSATAAIRCARWPSRRASRSQARCRWPRMARRDDVGRSAAGRARQGGRHCDRQRHRADEVTTAS